MKTYIILLILIWFSVVVQGQVLFDPENYNSDSLPEGMKLTEIGGKTYLKVAMDQWNSVL
jgi:hypothetical protein